MRIREQHEGVELEGELFRILGTIERAFGLRVANSRLELSEPIVRDLNSRSRTGPWRVSIMTVSRRV